MPRLLLVLALLLGTGCSSLEVVRLPPDVVHVPKGYEPVAGLQATCMGFYLFTFGIPETDLEKAVNELLVAEAKKLGADKIVGLRFDATPGSGIWWLTKLLWFRFASASGIAVKADGGGTQGGREEEKDIIPPEGAEGGPSGAPGPKPAPAPSVPAPSPRPGVSAPGPASKPVPKAGTR